MFVGNTENFEVNHFDLRLRSDVYSFFKNKLNLNAKLQVVTRKPMPTLTRKW